MRHSAPWGKPREGLPYIEESLPIFRALYDADKSNRLARLDLAESEENAGNLWVALGDPAKAVDHCRSAVQLLGAPPNPPDSDLELSAALVEAQMDLAQAYASAAQAASSAPNAGGVLARGTALGDRLAANGADHCREAA